MFLRLLCQVLDRLILLALRLAVGCKLVRFWRNENSPPYVTLIRIRL